ncbi:MAG: YfhO family protein [Candidatus Margulisbacteria bacterium]|nr:YfhO family protein [Candidatus Margulisiibacteriota bacterium]
MMKIDRQDFLVFIGFLGLVLLFFSRFLTADQIFAFKDLSRYFYPLRYLMVEQVKAGSLPLWNPYIFCGFPLLATLQIGFFYPLTLIYYLLPFNLAFNYYIILHYFLAACFMYLLLRYFKLRLEASFAGGLIFAFSGYLLSVSNMNTSLSSVIWLPLVLIFFDKSINVGTGLVPVRNNGQPQGLSLHNVVVLAILLALQFLGGEPTIIYVTLIFLVAYGAVFAGSWRAFGRSVLGLGQAGLITLGLVAIQLLPFLELAKYSDRVARTAYDIVTFRSFPPRELINFIFPYFFGNPAQFGGFTETLIGKGFQDWLISPYLGILPLVFVFLAFDKNKKLAKFFLITSLVALLLAFGKYTPLYHLVYFIPGISMIRYPVKYLFLVTFCLVILSAMGFDQLLSAFDHNKERLRRLLRVLWLGLSVLSLLFLLLYFLRNELFVFLAKNYSTNMPQYFFDLLASIIEFNLLSFFFVIVYLFAFSLLLLMAYQGRIKKTLFAALVVLLVAADLFSNSSTIAVPVSARVFSQVPENYQILQQDKGLYRFFYTPELEKENRLILGKDYDDALLETRDNLTANWHIPYYFFDFYGYESIKPMGLFEFYRQSFKKDKLMKNLRFLSRYNVRYIAASESLRSPFLKLLRHKKKYGLEVYLYENQNVLPRAYVLYGNKGPESRWTRVETSKYSPNEIIISAKLNEPGRLFLSDAYYPGWQVYVDGRRTKIDREAKYFRSVKLEPGQHQVRFVYSPLSLKLGAVISLLTVLSLIILIPIL